MMRKEKTHSISGVFVFLLLGLFAVFGTILVLLGSQAYRGIVERTAAHNESRILQSFVSHAVRAEDSLGSVSIQNADGMVLLCIRDEADDPEGFATYLYVYEDHLCELYQQVTDDFVPDRGEIICGASSFDATIDGQRLSVQIADLAGNIYNTSIVLYAGEVTP